MEQYSILEQIESLRNHLYVLADLYHGNLLHPQVIQASEDLDTAIQRWNSWVPRRQVAG